MGNHIIEGTYDALLSEAIFRFPTRKNPEDFQQSCSSQKLASKALTPFSKPSFTIVSIRLQCKMPVNPIPADNQSVLEALSLLMTQVRAITIQV